MAKAFHTTRFPGETDEYRDARNALLKDEMDLRRKIEAVAARRRTLPLGGVVKTDYVFDASSPGDKSFKTIHLSELFAPGKDTLFIYNFMFPESVDSDTPCPTCTSIIDAVDGASRHLEQRINFAVVAKAPIERFRAHGNSRGWRHALLLSSAGSTFNQDYHAEDPNGGQWPLAHVFARRGGRIHHAWSSELWFAEYDPGQHARHVDFMWPMWHIFDTTPEGRATDWMPQLEY
jgi:predicted dithiol-disulfide oxidoreductase (DUF899 family)